MYYIYKYIVNLFHIFFDFKNEKNENKLFQWIFLVAEKINMRYRDNNILSYSLYTFYYYLHLDMANCKISEIIKCMKILLMKELNTNEELCENVNDCCDPSSADVKCSCHHSRNSNLDLVLKRNMSFFLLPMKNVEIKELIEKQGSSIFLTDCLCFGYKNELFQPISCSSDVIWEFVIICLKTLLSLTQCIQGAEDEECCKQKQNNDVHLPNIIGVQDQETICSLLELVMSFGIFPNLLPGVGRPIKSTNFEIQLSKSKMHPRKLLLIIYVLVLMMKNKILHSLILSKSSNDIIASLIQLRYCPMKCCDVTVTSHCCCVRETSEFKGCINCSSICQHEKKWCEIELDYMLTRTYQPFIIKELLILQRCSLINKKSSNKWFLKIIGHKLSKCIMQENGVKYVIEGILAGCNAGKKFIYCIGFIVCIG